MLSAIMLRVITQDVIMLSVTIPNVIMLSDPLLNIRSLNVLTVFLTSVDRPSVVAPTRPLENEIRITIFSAAAN
jgi:hypothetical protein